MSEMLISALLFIKVIYNWDEIPPLFLDLYSSEKLIQISYA